MSGMAGQIRAQGINTNFVAIGETMFSNPDAYGPWTRWTGRLQMTGTELMAYLVGAIPAVAEINKVERPFSSSRYYARRVPVKRYGPEGIEFPRIDVENDISGAVSTFLGNYLGAAKDMYGLPANQFIISNPTGIDEVSLISSSHPFDSGGSTWTNTSSNALSAAELITVVQAMRGRLGETGVSLGIKPDLLMVPPGTEQLALDITGSVRPVGVGTAGGQSTSASIAGVVMPNWLAGKLDVQVNPYMTSGTWFVMATSNPTVKPIYYGEAEAPKAFVVDDPNSEPMRLRSAYGYYVEGHAAFIGGIPQCIYGKAS